MGDGINKVDDIASENNKWELEEDVRIVRRYFELKANPDKFDKAMATIKKENDALSEELKKEDVYKEKIGFSKK